MDGPVLAKGLPAGSHLRLERSSKVILHFVIVPRDIDRHRFQEPSQRGSSPLVIMLGAILRQRSGDRIRPRLIRRRQANAVGIDGIAEKNEEIRPLSANGVENRVARLTLKAAFLPAQLPAPR